MNNGFVKSPLYLCYLVVDQLFHTSGTLEVEHGWMVHSCASMLSALTKVGHERAKIVRRLLLLLGKEVS